LEQWISKSPLLPAKEGGVVDRSLKQLTSMKANYGPVGQTITLRWEPPGRFRNIGPATEVDRIMEEKRAEAVFVRLLRLVNAQGMNVSANPGPTYAPSKFAKRDDSEGVTKEQFQKAMERLLIYGVICIVTYKKSDRREGSRLVLDESKASEYGYGEATLPFESKASRSETGVDTLPF